MKNNEALNLDVSQATHVLICRHCVGRNCKEYLMKCIVLNVQSNGKLKILVFGERYWKDKEHIKNIKYVESCRVSLIK